MSQRHQRARTAITLAVLSGVLVFMALYGVKTATAPFPGAADSTPDCTAAEKQVDRFVTRAEVQVSVFNSGDRPGLATRTLERLEAAGFRPGATGNAPTHTKVNRAEVWTTREDDTAARLVARTLGKRTKVVVTSNDLGPGVDVVVGNKFRKLDRKAPKRLRLPRPEETCVDVG